MKDPVVYREFGYKSLIFAAVFGLTAAGLYGASFVQRSGIGKTAEVEAQACADKFTALGASATSDGTAVRATWSDLSDPGRIAGSASAASLACPGWKLKAYCIGSGCDVPGASLELGRSGEGAAEDPPIE